MPFFQWENKQIFYREAGSGDALLIIPGSTASSAHHQTDLQRLSQGDACAGMPPFRTISFDWPGTGQSDRLESWDPRWLEKVADCGAALLAELHIEQAVVMGPSGGAMVALLMALRCPRRVRALIVDSTALDWTPQMLRASVAGRQPVSPAMQAFWQHGHGADWQRVVEQDSQAMLDFAEREDDWLQGRLGEIDCPLLLTGSLQDELVPDIGEQMLRIANAVRHSSLFLHNDGAHPLMWSKPHIFFEQMKTFLARINHRPA